MKSLFDIKYFFQFAPKIIVFFPQTILMVVIGMFLGTILGLLNAIIRYRNVKGLSQVLVVYNSFMKGTPLLVQLLIVYYGSPMILKYVFGVDINSWDAIVFACVTIALNECAYSSAIFYSAISAVPIGQTEAAYSVGMTYFSAFRRIILPQAIRAALPPYGNDFIAMFESTSVVYMIGVKDMVSKAQNLGISTGHTLEAYLFIAVIYIAFSIMLRLVFATIHRKLEYDKGDSETKGINTEINEKAGELCDF